MNITLTKFLQILGLGICIVSGSVNAAPVQEIAGDTVIFRWHPEDVDSKYGNIQVSGDTIFVTPTDFRAESTNGAGTVNSSGTGTIQIIAKDGYALAGIDFGELGDYKMSGDAGDSVDVTPWLRVFDYASPIFGASESQFVPVTGDLTLNDGVAHEWSAIGGFDLTTAAWDGVNQVGLTLQNTLEATTTNTTASSAWIQKKAIGSSISVSTVPVPAAVWLFGSGLIGLLGMARRRKA